MFGGGKRQIHPKYVVQDQDLTIRPYNQKLTQLTNKLCGEIGLADNDVCLFETRTAFDCLLRQKVQKFGGLTDNIGHCSHHINNMKKNLENENPVRSDFAKLLDNKLEELNYMRKSFV